nr:protein cordon-bleu isoform X2 [Pogona vitticeps]
MLIRTGNINRRRMKARAPPPPNHPPNTCKVNNEHKLTTDMGMLADQGVINMRENLINRTVEFTVVFPNGEEQKDTVHGSKAVMDLLVDLCSRHHLNPAHHTLDLLSWETQQPLSYKPNTLIGVLDVQKIHLKEKVPEGKTKRPPPKIPEKTVRLVVNYLKTQKTVVRVSPEVPLQSIIPAICEKCEVNQEYLVLLRDTFTGEELELTKSLNELGIKELYAWDRKRVLPSKAQSEPSLNYRETRNSSTIHDTTEKEKKRFLGFFKTSKRNSRTEENLTTRMDGDCGSEGHSKAASASEQSLEGVTRAPHSTSVNSCSITLGPSLSLGNISGMTGSMETKKRRAPPPPTVVPQLLSEEKNGQEKVPNQMSQDSSQNDLQKKKRRAPPPPIPITPERTEEIEDKRKSTVGNGRHVPQKPPRGNTRGPPQLMIPPPPPYPPPDRDAMDPTVQYSERDVTDPTKLVPKRNLQLSPDIYSTDDVVLELSEIEETTSLSSCLASEDTTEDSGVMSSLSDVVSLNSQNDSMRSRDKSLGAQETSPEMDSMFAIEACSGRNTSFNSDDAGNILQRSSNDEQIMQTKFEDADMFIDARLQETLAALDKDLAAMEGIHDNSESGSLSSEMNEAFSPLPQNAEADLAGSLPVPVTIIDEVLEGDLTISCNREGESLLSRIEANEDISVQSNSLGELHNKNNNIADELSCLSKNLSQQQIPYEDLRHQVEEQQKNESETHVSMCEKNNKQDAVLEIISKNEEIISENDSQESKTKMITSDINFTCEIDRREEKVKQMNVENTKDELLRQIKTELEFRNASAKSPEEKEGSLSASLWCHRIHNGITNYENKLGLRTFKVVPHKPEVKYFERDASLSTGAIKIDELGNLVTPNAGGIRNIIVNSTTSDETEETLIERAKAYWRSNSMEKQLEEPPISHPTKTVVSTHSKNLTKISQTKPESLTSMKALSPLAASGGTENKTVFQKRKPAIQVTQSSVRTFTAPVVNTDKMEFSFQKPRRRTSSYYVASAIAKSIAISQVKTNQERCDKEENNNEKGVKTETDPLSKGSIVMTRTGPVETQPKKIEESSSFLSCSKNTSNILPLGAHFRNNTANIKSPDQTEPTNCYREPHHGTSSKDSVIAEGEHYCSSKQNVIVREIPFLPNQKKEQIDPFSSPFFLKSSNVHSSSISFSSSVKSTGEYSFNRRTSAGTLTVNHMSSKKDEKHDDTPAKNEPESNIKDNSIYNVFGPKKKFKPVIQKPLPKDSSLHSALMAAIQSAGGREKLQKISPSTGNETQKKPLLTEPENERSALLAAIRGHSGTSKLRKVSSSASEELQRFRSAEAALQNRQASATDLDYNQPPPPPPPPPPPSPPSQLTWKAPKFFANKIRDSPGDTRQALMEEIRSGTGAARLKKVPLLV